MAVPAHKAYSPRITGGRVQELRAAGRWTHAALAAEMKARGFRWHATTVARTESGERPVKLDEAAALADIFAVPLDSLGRAA